MQCKRGGAIEKVNIRRKVLGAPSPSYILLKWCYCKKFSWDIGYYALHPETGCECFARRVSFTVAICQRSIPRLFLDKIHHDCESGLDLRVLEDIHNPVTSSW